MATGTYAEPAEAFPLKLQGDQQILCNQGNGGRATIRGRPDQHVFDLIQGGASWTTGVAISDCIIDGQAGSTENCIVQETGSPPLKVAGVDIANCHGGVTSLAGNAQVTNSTIHNVNIGVAFYSSGQVSGNSFSGNGFDIWCSDSNTLPTGSGNMSMGAAPSCFRCSNCPFYP